MRIAITGATGFIGRNLATRALESGHQVTAFTRRAWSGPPYVPLADRHFLELPARPEMTLLADVDVLVHLAIAPQGGPPELIDAVNRVGTLRLFEASQRAGVGRFVFLSSQSAHEGVSSAYGRSKYAVEQALSTEPGVVIVRPGMVYGESDDGLMGRATRTAASLRAFPVIGGDEARAQPVHVLHLADAILALGSAAQPPRLVMLGDQPVRLSDMIRTQAHERYGVRPRPIQIPMRLARNGVRLLETLHIPSPISEANLDGIEAFEPMDTASDEALVRELIEQLPGAARVAVEPVEPRRLILIGAGRIGLVHALTAAHHQEIVLVGLVDLDRAATARLASVAGPHLPQYTDLQEAIVALRPDAAIVATPPASHVPLAKQLLAAGIDVLLEKPVAATEADRRELVAALAQYPDRYLGTGYLAGVLPHVAAIAADLKSGRFGRPTAFDAHAFATRVEAGVAEKRAMWELDPQVSGGGALVNVGVHVLAMIELLLGGTDIQAAVLVGQAGRSTEDAATLRLRAGGVTGTFTTAWHLAGFNMPENYLRIDTDRGYVVCTTACAAFVSNDEICVIHQVDADRGFDLAPMDAGGGFWNEQQLLALREHGANSVDVADRIEGLISDVYQSAERVSPALGELLDTAALPVPAPTADGPIPDLRGAPRAVEAAWSGRALVGSDAAQFEDRLITLPDAPGHFRTLTNEGPAALIRALGVTHLGRAAFGVSPLRAASKIGRPWEALLAMLRAEAVRIPRTFRGALIVDAYLVDLATATGRIDGVVNALADLRARCPGAQIGIEVNACRRLEPHLPVLGKNLDVVIALGTTREASLSSLHELLPRSATLIVKTGVLPRELLELAWNEPERWTHGLGPLVVHWPGSPDLRGVHDAALARARSAAGAHIAEPSPSGRTGYS